MEKKTEKGMIDRIKKEGISFDFIKENVKTIGDLKKLSEEIRKNENQVFLKRGYIINKHRE